MLKDEIASLQSIVKVDDKLPTFSFSVSAIESSAEREDFFTVPMETEKFTLFYRLYL